jgi:Trm5-related predicted tRNA methylase
MKKINRKTTSRFLDWLVDYPAIQSFQEWLEPHWESIYANIQNQDFDYDHEHHNKQLPDN